MFQSHFHALYSHCSSRVASVGQLLLDILKFCFNSRRYVMKYTSQPLRCRCSQSFGLSLKKPASHVSARVSALLFPLPSLHESTQLFLSRIISLEEAVFLQAVYIFNAHSETWTPFTMPGPGLISSSAFDRSLLLLYCCQSIINWIYGQKWTDLWVFNVICRETKSRPPSFVLYD